MLPIGNDYQVEQTWVTLAERPDLYELAIEIDGEATSTSFMQHDEIGHLVTARRLRDRWPEHFLVLLDDDRVCARAVSIPFSMADPNRAELPTSGWDGAVRWAIEDSLDGVEPTVACALEVNVDPSLRGRGVSSAAIQAMKLNSRSCGMSQLVTPVRPPDKARQPWRSMATYASQVRADGLPVDRWLRVHVRAGGEIVGIAPFSMVVIASIEEWREWTGLPLDNDGPVAIADGLVPVLLNQKLGVGVYAEPNVWIRHIL
jgi:hypothetical protein